MRLFIQFSAAGDVRANRATVCATLIAATIAASIGAGCGGGSSGSSSGSTGGGGGSAGNGVGGDLFGSGAGPTNGTIPNESEFIQADNGAFALGVEIGAQGIGDTGVVSSDDGCNILVGVVRDFKGKDEPGSHPDFETFAGSSETKGLVADLLGSDQRPVYASKCESSGPVGDCEHGPQTTSKQRFDEWYRFAEGTNKAHLIYFQFVPNGEISTFESDRFFPLDNAGWGNSGMDEDDVSRNFHFTTELHTRFKYQGGETFRFSGDDDLWVFINGKLAIDLGGLHPSVTDQIDLDDSAGELGIEKGNVYALELFHAERHTTASNFRVDTNLAFVDCGVVLPDPK